KLDTDGRVIFKFIVDTMGHPEPNSFEILKVSDSAFVEPARLTVLAQEFRPARDHGQNMRSYATSEIKFKAGKMPCDVQMKGATGTICVDSLRSNH
ncbi:MAG TPA: energy transducer TonB, partial [Gemmatimonadales bacterium]|nr:energy transducer TonB [Gemmatimonadales bacterium]